MALTALEEVGTRLAGLGNEDAPDAASDPAGGTLVVSPDHHLKIVKSINRELGRIKRRLYFQYLKLRCLKLLFQTKARSMEAVRDMNGFLLQVGCKITHLPLRLLKVRRDG
jgi:hypothetical protein